MMNIKKNMKRVRPGTHNSWLTGWYFRLVGICLVFLNCAGENLTETENSYVFRQIHFFDGTRNLVLADFDGDGYQEYALNTGIYGPVINNFDDEKPKTTNHILGSKEVPFFQAVDFTGDSAAEILLQVAHENQIWYEIWKTEPTYTAFKTHFIWRSEAVVLHDYNQDGKYEPHGGAVQICDLNGDSLNDVLACLAAEYDLEPRSLVAFDGKTGRQMWEFPVAGHPSQPQCSDFDGDGELEVLFSTFAPGNGHHCGNMTDSLCYLICLERNGQLRWNHPIGGKYCSVHFKEIPRKGNPEIVCNFADGKYSEKSTHFQLQVRDGSTGNVRRYFQQNQSFQKIFPIDLDRDGVNEIVSLNENGTLFIFTTDLEVVRQKKLFLPVQRARLLKVLDLDQDGSPEFLITSENRMEIFTADFKCLARYESNLAIRQIDFFHHPVYGNLLALVRGHRDGMRNSIFLQILPISEFNKVTTVARQKYGFLLIIFSFLLGIILTMLTLRHVPRITQKIRDNRLQERQHQRKILLEKIALFYHGAKADNNFTRLCTYFKSIQDEGSSVTAFFSRLNTVLQTYEELTAKQLSEIIWRAKAAQLASKELSAFEESLHRLNEFLNDVQKNQPDLRRLKQLAPRILSTVDDLDQRIQVVMHALFRYFRTDVISLIKQSIVISATDLEKQGIELVDFRITGTVNVFGLLGETDGLNIFEELIRNAMRALENVVSKKISVAISTDEENIYVDISDSGCGIPAGQFDHIFDREFSTKPDGGRGLYHARKTLNNYDSKIYVLQSTPGQGTMMRVVLRRLN